MPSTTYDEFEAYARRRAKEAFETLRKELMDEAPDNEAMSVALDACDGAENAFKDDFDAIVTLSGGGWRNLLAPAPLSSEQKAA